MTSVYSIRDQQWSEKKLTGGANWTPQVAPSIWGAPAAQMVREQFSPSSPIEQLLPLCRPEPDDGPEVPVGEYTLPGPGVD